MAPTCTHPEHPKQALEFHCESFTCEWWTCPDCCATYDVERGIKVTRTGCIESL